jgi:putative glutamine amidotransferase
MERDRLEEGALVHAEKHGLPLLGVCRGLQMINHHQGGRLRKVAGHVAVRHLVKGPLAPEGREVNSYHGLGLLPEDLGRDLEPLAWSDDGVIEAFRHQRLPWLGVMWHPEREEQLCPNDQSLILNHLKT